MLKSSSKINNTVKKVKPLKPKIIFKNTLTKDDRESIIEDISYKLVAKFQIYCDVCSSYKCHCAEAKQQDSAAEIAVDLNKQNLSDEELVKLAIKKNVSNYSVFKKIEYLPGMKNPEFSFDLVFWNYVTGRAGKMKILCNHSFQEIDTILKAKFTNPQDELIPDGRGGTYKYNVMDIFQYYRKNNKSDNEVILEHIMDVVKDNWIQGLDWQKFRVE